jgi:alpha-amylase
VALCATGSPAALAAPAPARTAAVAAPAAPAAPAAVTATGAKGATGGIKSPPKGQVRDVIANLFEWNWPSIGRECTQVLGPKGYGGVQVAPPQDSLQRQSGDSETPIVHTWWEVYQPVRYALTSRMGNEKQFRDMVATCRKAGVKVYVDAVINHMSGQGSTSYGGVTYSKYAYKGLYGYSDFHHSPQCPTASNRIEDFNNYTQVTKCELVGLSDLRTETARVQKRLAGYLNKLLSYGVSGFRVDAAKHIPIEDLMALQKRLRNTVDGTRPYYALEVVFGGPGKLSPYAFQKAGDLLGFDAATQLKDAFRSYVTPEGGALADLEVFGEESGLLPSSKSLAFVQNHDTEHSSDRPSLSYKDGAMNVLAHQFLLASGYATPQVYASFAFTEGPQGPPSDAKGFVKDTNCSNGEWVCTDRVRGVANMVGWHNVAGTAKRAHWYDNGQDLIAFSRGAKAWIVINHEKTARTRTFTTGLAKGTYCDVIHGNPGRGGTCSGPVVRVDAKGKARVTVASNDSVAIHVGALVRRS